MIGLQGTTASLAAAACALLAACTSDGGSAPTDGGAAPADGGSSPVDAATDAGDGDCDPRQGRVAGCAAVSCDERDQIAHQWIESLAACEVDADCQLIRLSGCLPAFLCDIPVSIDADVDLVMESAAALSAQHGAECSCSLARCLPAVGVSCASGVCVHVLE